MNPKSVFILALAALVSYSSAQEEDVVSTKTVVSFSDVSVSLSKDGLTYQKPIAVDSKGLPDALKVTKGGSIKFKFIPSSEDIPQLMVRFVNTDNGVSKTIATKVLGGARVATLDLSNNKIIKTLPAGMYSMDILGAGPSVAAPVAWKVGLVNLATGITYDSQDVSPMQKSLAYTFPSPPVQANAFNAMVFTALCASPLVLLIAMWIYMGVNLNAYTPTLSGAVFHLSTLAVLKIFTQFWFGDSMFVTLYYLVPVALVAFLSGNYLLRHHKLY